MNKRWSILALWVIFVALFTMGSECTDQGGQATPLPSNSQFLTYIAVGDSITQGVMSGDANTFTQGSSDYIQPYPKFLAHQMNTKYVTAFMVPGGDSEFRRAESTPTAQATNLGVSGMSVASSKSVFTLTITSSYTGTDNNHANDVEAVAAPLGSNGNTILDILGLKDATFVTCWLGNNDALGAVASIGTDDTNARPSSYPANDEFGTGGKVIAINYYGRLDGNDARGPLNGIPYRPQDRVDGAGQFATRFPQLIGLVKQNAPNAKIVVFTVPDVTAIAHLFSFAEVQKFFSTYFSVPTSATGASWNTSGFGGDSTAKIPLDILLNGLSAFSSALKQGFTTVEALQVLSNGSNTGFFDHDVNNITDSEITTVTNKIKTNINDVITSTANGDSDVILVDANKIFNDIVSDGATVTDADGNTVTSFLGFEVRKLSRKYPGSGDPSSTTGSETNGGLFSLDGVHPGPTAHAILTNEIIKQIAKDTSDGGFGITLPEVDVFAAWLVDPFVDKDLDGFVTGFSFTLQSSLKAIPRDKDDKDASVQDD